MKKHKFTWVDGLILAVVLLLVVGTCVKFLSKETTAVTQKVAEFDYQLEIRGIREFSVDALEVGDTLYEAEGKGQVGVIRDIVAAPAQTHFADSTGKVQKAPVEGKYDVILTITAQGTPHGDIYKVGTYNIIVNKERDFFTKYVTFEGTIVAIG